MKALMTIFQSIGVMALLFLLYAMLLVGCEKKIIFHPAKFPEAVKKAGYPRDPDLPNHMADLFDRKEHFTVLDNVQSEVQQFIAENILA